MLNGGSSVALTGSGLLSIGGTVTAASIGLTGSALAIPGLVNAGSTGAIALHATAGTIGETGTMIAGTLSGGATGAATLAGATGTANQIGTLSSFSVTNGDLTLNDGKALTVAGTVSAGPTNAATPNPANANTLTINVSGSTLALGVRVPAQPAC